MRKPLKLLAIFLMAAIILLAVAPAFQSRVESLLHPRFGNFLNAIKKVTGDNSFDLSATKWGIRWFPTYVHFGPDGDTLLVDLCHVKRYDFCRIGKYSISRNHWDILPYEANRTYMKAIFSPDGKWIVYTSAPCDKEARCDARNFQMFRMAPDGTKNELLADTVALYPSFAHNGKKLIYWRWNIITIPGKPKHAAGLDVYQLDWETKQETALTHLDFAPGDQYTRPFFTPDGEKFVFSASPNAMQVREMQTNRDAPARKENFYIGSMANVPIDEHNLLTLEPFQISNQAMYDMDRQGRILYSGSLHLKKQAGEPVALALRPADPTLPKQGVYLSSEEEEKRYPYHKLTEEQLRRGEGTAIQLKEELESNVYRAGEGTAFFLRKPGKGMDDEAAFDFVSAFSASISPESDRMAFVLGHYALVSNRQGLGIIGQGQPMKDVRFIDWPKLDLVPSAPVSNPATHP